MKLGRYRQEEGRGSISYKGGIDAMKDPWSQAKQKSVTRSQTLTEAYGLFQLKRVQQKAFSTGFTLGQKLWFSGYLKIQILDSIFIFRLKIMRHYCPPDRGIKVLLSLLNESSERNERVNFLRSQNKLKSNCKNSKMLKLLKFLGTLLQFAAVCNFRPWISRNTLLF